MTTVFNDIAGILHIEVTGNVKYNDQLSKLNKLFKNIKPKSTPSIILNYEAAKIEITLSDIEALFNLIPKKDWSQSIIGRIIIVPGSNRPILDMIVMKLISLNYPIIICESIVEAISMTVTQPEVFALSCVNE